MSNNEIFHSIRHAFDYSDAQLIAIFALAEHPVSEVQIKAWLKNEEDPERAAITDTELAIFLNGLIHEKRGKKEGPQPTPESSLTNNIIFRKLKIALDMQADDILQLMMTVQFKLSKHELSAFFRKPDHKHYRECKDQILRNFIIAVQLKHRGNVQLRP